MTTSELSKLNPQNGLILSSELIDHIKEDIQASKTENTKSAYASDWQIFSIWCAENNLTALPAQPETLAAFLSAQSRNDFAPPTLVRRCAAIKFRHESANHPSPTTHLLVKTTLQGIKRRMKHVPDRKAPATAERIADMISHCPNTLSGLRDKALLLLGFAGAFRRSELVALTTKDIERTPEGIKVTIRQSKTDQEGQGQVIAILNGTRFRIVDALYAWLKVANITEGPLFPSIKKGGKIQTAALTPRAVANIIKHYAHQCGFNMENFSGHSLRAGFLTSAAENGASVFKMMEVSRHRNMQTVAGYVRSAKMFDEHAGEKFL
jgi:site-specific recombinase XerD